MIKEVVRKKVDGEWVVTIPEVVLNGLLRQSEKVQELEEENRRYRKVINNINEKAMLYGVDEQVFEVIKEAIKALEGEE